MIAASEPESRRLRLEQLIQWLERGPRMQVRVRPYCPKCDLLMQHGKTANGLSHYYCPNPDCQESWKGKPRVV